MKNKNDNDKKEGDKIKGGYIKLSDLLYTYRCIYVKFQNVCIYKYV